MSLAKRHALVTGSTSGIGLAIARALAKEGADVMINGFGDKAAIEGERAKIEKEFGVKAFYHAADMAKHDYFEHEDLSGRSPADRVRASGYHEKLVGENLAYGPGSVEEVVQGWLDSPGHCENLMDPRFAEMGIAYAAGQSTRHGLFWVQLLAEPRT